jgi:hypothetical protein
MKQTAKALASVAAALEVATPDQVDPDFAVKLLEQIAADLSRVSEEELITLEGASTELAEESEAAGPEFQSIAAFFRSFPRGFLGG